LLCDFPGSQNSPGKSLSPFVFLASLWYSLTAEGL
jgi:hypothetical protein